MPGGLSANTSNAEDLRRGVVTKNRLCDRKSERKDIGRITAKIVIVPAPFKRNRGRGHLETAQPTKWPSRKKRNETTFGGGKKRGAIHRKTSARGQIGRETGSPRTWCKVGAYARGSGSRVSGRDKKYNWEAKPSKNDMWISKDTTKWGGKNKCIQKGAASGRKGLQQTK